MITYVYETIPEAPDEEPEQFEWRQRISEPALRKHPESGAPVRRVISGGLGFTSSDSATNSDSCCRGSCAC